MITNIVTGIVSTFSKTIEPTDPLASVAGFFFMRAPQGTTGDYITFQLIPGGKPDPDMSANVEVVPVQFDIWVEDQSGRHNSTYGLELAEQLIDIYDHTTISVTGGTCYRCDRQNKPNIEADPDGGWHVWIEYILQVQEA